MSPPNSGNKFKPRLRKFRTSADEISRQISQLRTEIIDLLATPEPDLAAVKAKQDEILAGQRGMQGLVIDQLTSHPMSRRSRVAGLPCGTAGGDFPRRLKRNGRLDVRPKESLGDHCWDHGAGDDHGHEHRILGLIDVAVVKPKQRTDGPEREARGHQHGRVVALAFAEAETSRERPHPHDLGCDLNDQQYKDESPARPKGWEEDLRTSVEERAWQQRKGRQSSPLRSPGFP